MREQKRVNEISDVITDKIMPVAVNKEYTVDMPVYDLRDYVDENQPVGICTFGGFIGELMITLSSIE